MGQECTDRRELIARAAQILAQEIEEGAQERAEGESHPGEGKAPPRRLAEKHEQGRATVEPMPPTRERGSLASAVVGRLAMVDDGVGHDTHFVAGAPGAPAQVQVVAVERQLRVESPEGVPDIAADEHPGRADRVHLAALIMLALVMLSALQPGHASTSSGDAKADLEEQATVVPAEGLGAEDRRARVGFGRGEESLQTGGRGSRVVMKKPDPLGGLDVEGLVGIGSQHPGCQAGIDGSAESSLRTLAIKTLAIKEYDAVVSQGFGEDSTAGIRRAGVDTDNGIRVTSLPAEDREDRGEPDRTITSDDDGRDAVASAQTACFFSRRRSRSDRPPQMPKRSSLASAYSRHSPRTSQDRHTRLASRVLPPFSGKNASGSVWAHSACSCHSMASSAPAVVNGSSTGSPTADLPPEAQVDPASVNDTGVIT